MPILFQKMTRSFSKLLFKKRPVKLLSLFRFFYFLAIFFELIHFKNQLMMQKQTLNCHTVVVFWPFSFFDISLETYQWSIYVCAVALILSSFGLLTRFSILTALLSFLFIFGISIGCTTQGNPDAYTPWNFSIVIFNFLVCLIAPKIEHYSIDQLFKKYILKIHTPPCSPYIPNWPLWLIKFNLIYAYFAGGIAKLRHGWTWGNGYTLQVYLLNRHLYLDTPWGYWLSQQFTLLVILSVGTLILEVFFPVALFSKRFAIFAVLITFLTQVIFYYITQLRWMHFFGWSYLIYLLEFIFWMGYIIYKHRPSKTLLSSR